MKIFIFYFSFFLFCYNSFSQTLKVQDTINSNIVVNFSKVKKSFKEASTSSMNTYYIPQSKSVIVTFEVPSFNFRLNTSLNDSAVFKSSSREVILQNMLESYVKEDQITYRFTFKTSKDSLIKMLSDKLNKVTFYFTPNEEKITRYLLENNQMTSSLKKYFIKISGKTIKYYISKPNKTQYEKLMLWLLNL
jgi:hypothetical protein